MRQPVAKMIGKPRREDLRLRFQSPERPGMNDAVAIPRVFTSIRMGCFRIAPPARMLFEHRPRRTCRNSIDGINSARRRKTWHEKSRAHRNTRTRLAQDFGVT